MARFALILAAVLVLGTSAFAQQQQTSKSPQVPSAPLRVQPLPHFPWQGKIFAEPIPSWNIHGHAEVIPNLPVIQLREARSWKGFRPVSPPSSLPQVQATAANAARLHPQSVNSSRR